MDAELRPQIRIVSSLWGSRIPDAEVLSIRSFSLLWGCGYFYPFKCRAYPCGRLRSYDGCILDGRGSSQKMANTGQWVSLCSDLARNPKTTKNAFIISYKPERVTTNTQAVLRLAWGGLAKGNQSCNKSKPNTGRQAWGRGLGASRTGASRDLGREKKRVFTISVTETIQHAPQGRRIGYWVIPKPQKYVR